MKSFSPLPETDLVHILDHTAALWEEARGKRFFITGGTGFFGVWLLESFTHINDSLGLNATATVLTRDPDSFARKAPHLKGRKDLVFHQGDIRDFDYPQGGFDYLIHAATDASAKMNQEQPGEMFDSILSGMRRILDFAATQNVSKMLFTSSGAIYGVQPSDLLHLPEAFTGSPDCLNPASAYGAGKRAAELMGAIQAAGSSCEFKVARCFAFVGPHLPLDAHFAIGNFLSDAIEGGEIKIKGDGTPVRSYLYGADLAIWLWTILFKAPSGRAYNVGSERFYDLAAIASSVARVAGKGSLVTVGEDKVDGRAIPRYVPSTHRANSELGLEAWVGLDDAIARTVTWYSEQILSNNNE